MKLSEVIKQFRKNNDNMSMDAFAQRAHVSKGYVSMLEAERNPKTGKPISPTIDVLAKIAAAMGMTIDELFSVVDDMPVDISCVDVGNVMPVGEAEIKLLESFRRLNESGKAVAMAHIEFLLTQDAYTK